MNDKYLKIIFLFTDLILPLAVGYWLKHNKPQVREKLDKIMLSNLYFISPVLGCLSFWIVKRDITLIWLPILGMLMQVIPGATAYALVNRKYTEARDKGSYILAVMFANRSVVGLLSVYILFGEKGYALGRLTMLLGPFAYYMIGFPVARYFQAVHEKNEDVKQPGVLQILFSKKQVPILGILLGLSLNFLNIERPAPMGSLFQVLIHTSAWLFLLPVGYDLNFKTIKHYSTKLYDLLFIRFMLIPATIIALCFLIKLGNVETGCVVVMAFTPASVGAVICAKLHKLNTDLTMAAYILTMILYLLFIFPILILYFRF